MNKEITILGAGNMGQAVARGILEQKVITPGDLVLSNPNIGKLKPFGDLGVTLESDNTKAVLGSEILVLSVKPQIMSSVLKEIKGAVDQSQLVISLAAGISLSSLRRELTQSQPIVRVMPNLPAQIGQSMSVWVKNENVTTIQEQKVKTILGAIGTELEVSTDDQIDRATAISGSGPAYVAYFWEVMIDSAMNLGFNEQEAQRLVRQTVIGTVQLIDNSGIDPKRLKELVTSKGGTTEAALKEFQRRGFRGNLMRGIDAAYRRAVEIKKYI
jgi:pyrroline-5-carboxylate reductase